MTENKRFEICGEGSTNIDVTTYIVEYGDGDDDCFELYESKEDSQKVCDKINNILDENEQLKSEIEKLSYANEDLLSEKRNWQRMSDEYCKLSEENEQLKQNCKNYNWYKQYKTLLNENKELKKELSEYKDFVLSDDKILCYTCLFCTHKGIYEVDCDVKGHVDVHGSCFSYTKKELQE